MWVGDGAGSFFFCEGPKLKPKLAPPDFFFPPGGKKKSFESWLRDSEIHFILGHLCLQRGRERGYQIKYKVSLPGEIRQLSRSSTRIRSCATVR